MVDFICVYEPSFSRLRQFDQDLDSVSKGLRKLKRLSQAFDEVIGRDERWVKRRLQFTVILCDFHVETTIYSPEMHNI